MTLPIDPFIPEILATLDRRRALVLTAAPGSGKTTVVGPALAREGKTILLQPRRVAARSLARYIAGQQGWTLGGDVGWQVRFERRFGRETRLLIATEGILTARAQADPLLSSFRTVVLDEFHERSLHADLALALARQAWLARDDLRLVVMSATLDVEPIAAFLGGCPVLRVPGRVFPLEVGYAPQEPLADAVAWTMQRSPGHVLCFLPGAPEIRRAVPAVEPVGRLHDAEVVALHGSLPAEQQDAAIAPTSGRRVILATNIAETSLTVPGVSAVVDTGWQKVVRYDAARGIDNLEIERVSRDAADQRAGRAGRTGPGVVRRLWDERDRLRPHRQPEIERVDLCGLLLDVLAWGSEPGAIEWLTPPSGERLDAAWSLLARLGAVSGRKLTPIGEKLVAIPLHPRLGRILVAAQGAPDAAAACALLSERSLFPPRAATTASDLLSLLDAWDTVPAHVARAARDIEAAARDALGRSRTPRDDTALRHALLAGYPDRVARRRAPGSPRLLMASGQGAILSEASGVRDAEWLVAVDVQSATQAPSRGDTPDAIVRLASGVERAWLEPTGTRREHRFDADSGVVRAFEVLVYGAIVLDERTVPPDPDVVAGVLADEWLRRPRSEADEQLMRRARFAALDLDLSSLVRSAATAARRLDDVDIAAQLTREERAALERLAPTSLRIPSGRQARLHYRDDGGIETAVKLQEVFGLAETPRLGPRGEPVLFSLLAPNGRTVQVTRDLRSFWNGAYQDVRKELRGRYPKHPWPEDPWTATPTARTRKR